MFRKSPTIRVKTPVLETPESFKGGNFKAGFQAEYTPFVIASIITFAITTFDLVTDWLAFRHVKSLNLDDWLHERTTNENDRLLWDMSHIYDALPQLYLAFCCIATIVYAIDVIRFTVMLYLKRRQFFEIRDGVPYRGSILEKYGGEILVLSLTIFHDIPLSLLFLALQAMVSCEFVISTNHVAFYAAVIATFISVTWKIVQVIWSAGCFGKRDEYTKGRWVTVLRCFTLILLIATLVVTTLNLALLRPRGIRRHLGNRHHHGDNRPLFDKVFIDSWLDDEYLVLHQYMAPSSHRRSSRSRHSAFNGHPHHYLDSYVDIIDVHKLIQDHNQVHVVTKSCEMSKVNMSMYLPHNTMRDYNHEHMHCSVVFHVFFDLHNQTLHVDYQYRLQSPRLCLAGSFMDSVAMDLPENNNNDLNDINEVRSTTSGPITDPESFWIADNDPGSNDRNDLDPDSSEESRSNENDRRVTMMHEVGFMSEMDETRDKDDRMPCKVAISGSYEYVNPCSGYS